MFGEIARFLLNTIFTLFGAALLLRAWMQVVRMPPYNPVSNAVMQATNWLVLPLRKILPAAKTIDWASIVAAFLAALVFVILLVLVAGVDPAGLAAMLPTLLLVAVITVIKWALNLNHLDDDHDGVAVVAEPAVPGHAAAVSTHGAIPGTAAARVAAHGRYRLVAYPAVRDRSGAADGRDAAGGCDSMTHVRGVD